MASGPGPPGHGPSLGLGLDPGPDLDPGWFLRSTANTRVFVRFVSKC